jgi:multiple sugar transport system permease protein
MGSIAHAEGTQARPWLHRFLRPDALTGYFLISPAVFLMLVLLAYPFVLAVWISLTDRVLGEPGTFIWLGNFLKLLQDSLFLQTVWNSFVYSSPRCVSRCSSA